MSIIAIIGAFIGTGGSLEGYVSGDFLLLESGDGILVEGVSGDKLLLD